MISLFFSLSNEDSYIKLCNKKGKIIYASEYHKNNDKKQKTFNLYQTFCEKTSKTTAHTIVGTLSAPPWEALVSMKHLMFSHKSISVCSCHGKHSPISDYPTLYVTLTK